MRSSGNQPPLILITDLAESLLHEGPKGFGDSTGKSEPFAMRAPVRQLSPSISALYAHFTQSVLRHVFIASGVDGLHRRNNA